ncbi:MAG: transcription termination/antitermination protein NusG [Bacilli bacterium]|nr:transcription termination/antitermination protein NusG [Bacilli bacterium]
MSSPNIGRSWYVVQSYSGCENAVKANIERRVESMNMNEFIFNVLVPEEKKLEKKKNGEYKEIITKPFPGYVFIDMIVTDETWFMIRNTPMVTGFLGSSGKGTKPVPLSQEEIDPILKMCGVTKEKKIDLNVGDSVQITSGPFQNQVGRVEEIDEDKELIKILIDVFGRLTPTEVGFDSIKKV